MNGLAYKRHLLNYMTYTHQYLAESNKELAQTDKTALCEMASHCMGILWVLADDIASDEFDRLELIEALDGLANRWVRAVEKWGRDLPHNRFAAYTAPIRERKALGQWPDPSSAPPKIAMTPSAASVANLLVASDSPGKPTVSDLPVRSNTAASGATSARRTPARILGRNQTR
jgi:hypothetical protein